VRCVCVCSDRLELLRAERENAMFPDEVDTPQDTPARIRFQKYRGLKSFRTSPWDPRENLPRDYARIFQFENFSRTKKRVLSQEDDEAALPGWYVTVQVKDVLKSQAEALDPPSKPLVVFGLLEHENKVLKKARK
jgi:pre-rRNA-processing protein TSR1